MLWRESSAHKAIGGKRNDERGSSDESEHRLAFWRGGRWYALGIRQWGLTI